MGCSPDEPEKHRAFIKKHKLRIRLLSDTKRTVMKKYGAWREKKLYGEKVMGVVRSTVLIDDKGIVGYHWRSVKSLGHAEKVQKTLETLQLKCLVASDGIKDTSISFLGVLVRPHPVSFYSCVKVKRSLCIDFLLSRVPFL